jgi:hypothetical protein
MQFVFCGISVFSDTCIRETTDSNLSLAAGYPQWGFSWFSSICRGKFQDSSWN